MGQTEANKFWSWMIEYVADQERIVLPNLGVFTLKQKYNFFIHFKPTGKFRQALKDGYKPGMYFTGDKDPKASTETWGPIIKKQGTTDNLSLHRRLIWEYAQVSGVELSEAANIIGRAINTMTRDLLERGRTTLTPRWNLSIKYVYSKSRWSHYMQHCVIITDMTTEGIASTISTHNIE